MSVQGIDRKWLTEDRMALLTQAGLQRGLPAPLFDKYDTATNSGGSMIRRASFGIALLALSHLAFANVSSALAQAGSIGGTIGKQDKSISGGVDAETRRAAPPPKRSATKAQDTSSDHSCTRIVGNWTWYLGLTETVFNQGGTARNSGGATGTLTCTGGTVVAKWSNGYVDRMSISNDGDSLSITNNLGVTWAATRK
jgi:hypothetical protein